MSAVMNHKNLDSREICNYCQRYYQLIVMVLLSVHEGFDQRVFSRYILSLLFYCSKLKSTNDIKCQNNISS